jgi:hypothetical protein
MDRFRRPRPEKVKVGQRYNIRASPGGRALLLHTHDAQ